MSLPVDKTIAQSGIATIVVLTGVFVLSLTVAIAGVYLYQMSTTTTAPSGSNQTATPSSTPVSAKSDIDPMEQVSVPTSITVFFSKHPDSDDNFDKVFQASRVISENSIAAMAFNALLVGPTVEEKSDGLFSDWNVSGESSCDGNSFTLSQAGDGRLTIKLCKDYSSGGIGQDARAKAIADATLTQFTAIKSVMYLDKSDNCLFDQSGQNMCKQ